MSRPTAWSTVWTNFLRSFGGKKRFERNYVGEDKFGNRYYEMKNPGNVTNISRGIDAAPDTPPPPPEWHMWLKNTRKYPPTVEEIEYTKLRQEQMQLNLQKQDAETERRAPLVQSQGRSAADVDRATLYPSYRDIEIVPGAKVQHGTYTEHVNHDRHPHMKDKERPATSTGSGNPKRT